MPRLINALFVLTACVATPLQAEILNVPADHPTIQGAIDAAVDGDTVLIADGVYEESIRVTDKAISIRGTSRDGTIIAGTQELSAKVVLEWKVPSDIPWTFAWVEVEGPDQRLENLTFQNCYVELRSGTQTIRNCRFTDLSTTPTKISSIVVQGCNGFKIEDCLFTDCRSSREIVKLDSSTGLISECQFGTSGHGNQSSYVIREIYSALTVNDCVFDSNQSNYVIYSGYNADLTPYTTNDRSRYERCVVKRNTATPICISNKSKSSFRNCVVVQNSGARACGILITGWQDQSTVIENCTIADNTTVLPVERWRPDYGHAVVGGIMVDCGYDIYDDDVYYPSFAQIRNNILWNNDGWKEINGPGEDPYQNIDDTPGDPTDYVMTLTKDVTYCLIEGGYVSDSSLAPGNDGPGIAILDTDPLFVDPANGDYRLQPGSPAIDAGDPNSPLDADGSTADLGAYPYLTFAPEYETSGFLEPLESSPVTVKGNRVLPLKFQAFDEGGNVLTELESAPKVKVTFTSVGGEPVDVTGEALPEGVGLEEGFFVLTGDTWHFNLETKPFQESGEYTIEAVTGDAGEYKLAYTAATFIRE